MKVNKGPRHGKIIGDFGESLVCNWLSRSGFEVSIVDHTGIDIVAYNPNTTERLGITVKSRTRDEGKEEEPVHVLDHRKGKDDLQKVKDACQAFGCLPWIAVYVETERSADLYLTSLKNYEGKYRGKEGKAIDDWKMRKKDRDPYDKDPDVKHIHMEFQVGNWWEGHEGPPA